MRINIKILNNKRTVIAAVFFLCVVFIFLLLQPVWAGEFGTAAAKAVVSILGWIVYFFAYVIGLILTLIIKILIVVAGYSDIIGVKAVITGWVIVRDLCNMFFILILLVIAFATILRIESYNAKKLLPKLLIMAVLINFSRTICGLIIDFAQVIMLTFVNGFAAAGEGNLVKVFQIEKFLAFTEGDKETKAIGGWETAGAILAGFIAIVITFIVVLVLLAVLVMRIIMLWVYTILSPLAFLLAAFPAGQKYSSQWWSEFSKNVIVGPVLAFFIWLALLTAHDSASGLKGISTSATTRGVGGTDTINLCAANNKLFCGDSFQTYIITIALLIGGLMVTQQIGGIAGAAAGKGMAAIQKGKGLAVGGALKFGKNIGGWAVDKASLAVGADLNVVRGYKRWKAQREENKGIRETDIYGKAVETADKGGFFRSKLALLSTGNLAWQHLTSGDKDNYKRFWKGGKWANKFGKQLEEDTAARKQILSAKEGVELNDKLSARNSRVKALDHEIHKQEKLVKSNPTNENIDKLKSLNEERNSVKKEAGDIKGELRKKIDDKEANRLDNSIKENKKLSETYALKGAEEKLAAVRGEMESSQTKKIASVDNSDQLGRILKEAIKEGNSGLIAAVSKKLTKNSDYNEMMSAMGLGTGRDGLLKLAHIFQDEGKMDKQQSLGLIAEIGTIAKGINHFAAFGATTMENGRWRESSEDEMQAAQLAEMLKVQPQAYARLSNRLGQGHYIGPEQTMENWRPNKSSIAYAKLHGDALAKQYSQTGQQNMLEHIRRYLDMFEKNGVTTEFSKTIIERTKAGKGHGAEAMAQIRDIKI